MCLRNVYSHCTTRSDEQDWSEGIGRERTRRRDIIVLTTHLYQEPPSPVPDPFQFVRTRLLYRVFMLLLMFGSWEWTRGQLETNVGQPVIGNIKKTHRFILLDRKECPPPQEVPKDTSKCAQQVNKKQNEREVQGLCSMSLSQHPGRYRVS